MTDYVLGDSGTVNISVEGQSKAISNKATTAIPGAIVPLRKAFIQLNPYEIKNGIPVGKSVASNFFAPTSSAKIGESTTNYLSYPSSVDFGQTFRWALGSTASPMGYFEPKNVYTGTYSAHSTINGITTITITQTSDYFATGDVIALQSFTDLDGEYIVDEIDQTNNWIRIKTPVPVSVSPFNSCNLYKIPQWFPYPNSLTGGSFNWASPITVSGGIALSTSYSVLYSKSIDYKVLKLTTTSSHWFYPGLKIRLSSSIWNLSTGTGFSWTGNSGTDLYEVLETPTSTTFTVVARSNVSYDSGTNYLINANSYAYPEIETSQAYYKFNQGSDYYSYPALDFTNSIKHLYAKSQRLGAVDEFSIAIVASPSQSSNGTFGILAEADNTIYQSNNYAFNETASSSIPIVTIVRSDGLVTVTYGNPGFNFTVGDVIRIGDCIDSSFNGTFSIASVDSVNNKFSYYQNAANSSVSASGNVYVYASDQDEQYKIGSPFIYQNSNVVYFGDNQYSPETMNTGQYNSYNYPTVYFLVARKNEIDLYISTQSVIYNKTVARKNPIVRKNLITNSNFEVDTSGWTGLTRSNALSGKSFYGSYYCTTPIGALSGVAISSYSRNASGTITLTFGSDPGAGWAAGDFLYWSYSSSYDGGFASAFPTDFYGPIKTKSTSAPWTVTLEQSESNQKQTAYSVVSGSPTIVPTLYKMGVAYTTNTFAINENDASHGVSFSAVDASSGAAFVRFYNSGGTLLETRFISTFEKNITPYSGTTPNAGPLNTINRTKGKFYAPPAGATQARLYICSRYSYYLDAVTVEPNPKNFNYFVGDGPKYDLDFVFGRMTGTMSPGTFFSGSLMEIDYWNSAVTYDTVKQTIAKMRTVYGG